MTGTNRSICMLRSMRSSPRRVRPAATASAVAMGMPMARPHSTRVSDAQIAGPSVPSRSMSQPTSTTFEGAARSCGLSQPTLAASSQRAKNSTTPRNRSTPLNRRRRRVSCLPGGQLDERDAGGGRGHGRRRCRPDRSASRPSSGRRSTAVTGRSAPPAACDDRVVLGGELLLRRRPSPGSHPRRRRGRRGAAAPSRTSPGRVTKLVPPFSFTISVRPVQRQLVLVDVHGLRDLVGVRRRVLRTPRTSREM